MKRTSALIALLLAPSLLLAQAGQVVGTNGVVQAGAAGNWNPDIQAGASAQVTTNNPRVGFGGYGSGSLELSVTGNQRLSDGQYPDWGFYSLTSTNPNGFGNLSDLNRLSFDWFRSSDPNWNSTDIAADWPYKTPVLRLKLQDQNSQISELIWEGYFNRGVGEALNGAFTTVDKWVHTENMQGGNFWFNRPPTGVGQNNLYVGTSCENNLFTFWQGGIPGSALSQLLGTGGCLAGANAKIVGISVGVGSQWPMPYHGFVDNVQMGFAGSEGLAVDANFDFVPTSTVPEPSTWALMGAGLIALGVAARRRQKPKA